MKMKIAVIGLLVMSFGVACKGANSNKQENAQSVQKIGVVISTLNNPFFVTLKNGIEKATVGFGYEVVVFDSQNDSAKELSGVEDLITKGVHVILLNPTDSDAVGNAVKLANDANIPVITLDRAANSGKVASHIASDNVKGGKLAGEFILKELNGKGKVVELEGIAGTTAARDRGKGFNEAVNGKLEVVARQTADFDRTKGLSVMENILQAQPDIQAVFAHNDEMALGALKAIQSSGRDIIIVGFDAIDDAIKAVEQGKMAATVAQQPEIIGKMGVETADKILQGQPVEENIPVALKIIVKEKK